MKDERWRAKTALKRSEQHGRAERPGDLWRVMATKNFGTGYGEAHLEGYLDGFWTEQFT